MLTLRPLAAVLGAEVVGFDFARPVDAPTRDALVEALDEHLLLLFRNGAHPPTDQQVVDLCEALGPLRPSLANLSRLPDHPAINRVSNRDAGEVIGTGGAGPVTWHSDLHFRPPLIEFLYLDALAVPDSGGDTCFANLRAAYDALPADLRGRIADLGVSYRLRDGVDFSAYFKASDPSEFAQETEVSLVHTNPRNGRRSVWPNVGPDFSVGVTGLDQNESAVLLRELLDHATQDRFVYRHVWRRGDAVLWLNTQVLHQRDPFPDEQERVMRHVNILGVADPRQLV